MKAAKKLSPTLRKMIEEIPGDYGWTKGLDDYLELAANLIRRGFTEEQAADFLNKAYWAAAGEYGV